MYPSIEITHDFGKTDKQYNCVPISEVEEYLKMHRDCYERTGERNRVYIDIDGKADINMSETDFIKKDKAIETILLNLDLGSPFSLMKASKYKGIKASKQGKNTIHTVTNIISYRITLLKKYGSKPSVKHYVETILNPIIKDALKPEIIYATDTKELNDILKNNIATYVDYDDGVYSLPTSKLGCGRKMRMWNSIKHKDIDYRPNVICGNFSVLDTLITYIPDDCEPIPHIPINNTAKKTSKNTETPSIITTTTSQVPIPPSFVKKDMENVTICSDPHKDISANSPFTDKDWNDITELVTMLSEERATNYTTWRDTIFCLRNIEKSPRMLELCIAFSKKSTKHRNMDYEGSTTDLYNSANTVHENPLTIKSLYYWAKRDSPEKYNLLISNQTSRDTNIYEMLTEGYISLAHLYYKMHGDKILIMYDSDRVSKNTYYFFNDKTGLWDTIIKETLASDISEKLSIIIKETIHKYVEQTLCLDKNKTDENVKKEQEDINAKIKELRKLHFQIQDIKRVYSVASHVISKKQKEQYEAQKMNKNPGFLSVKNGMINLSTGELIERTPEHYQTFYIDIDYDANADTSLMETFINNMFNENDKDVKKLLCNLIGYSVMGIANKKIFPLIVGDGDNGKSELINIIKETVGKKYLGTVEYEELSAANANTNLDTLYNARNARLLIIIETKMNAIFNENKLKKITGRDSQHVSAKYKNAEEMTDECIPWIISNFKPKFSGEKTIWNRIINIPLKVQFINKNDPRWDEDAFNEGTIKPKDPSFIKKLYSNKQGILRWIVKQSENYTKEGLQIPEAIQKEKEDYIEACTKEDVDAMKVFIESYWIRSENNKGIPITDIIEQYKITFPKEKLLSNKQIEAKIIPALKSMDIDKKKIDKYCNGKRDVYTVWMLNKIIKN